jgi:RNA polymerase sigma-B factor
MVDEEKCDPPGQETTETLFHNYATTRDSYTRHQIISRNLNLVKPLVKKFIYGAETFQDLLQVGYIGLIKAVDLYDVRRNIKFSTFATHWIEGEIRHHLRDRVEHIRRPRWLVELTGKVNHFIQRFEQEHHRPPALEEISSAMNVSLEGIEEIMKCSSSCHMGSLDAEGAGEIEMDRIKSLKRENFKLSLEDRIALEEALGRLKNVEKKIIYMIFYYDLTQMQIAQKLGISQKKVSRLLQKGIESLKQLLQR